MEVNSPLGWSCQIESHMKLLPEVLDRRYRQEERVVMEKSTESWKCKHLKTRQRKRSSKRYGNQSRNNQECAVSQKQEQNKFQNGEKSNLKY